MENEVELLLEDYKRLYKEEKEKNEIYEKMIQILLLARFEADISLKNAEKKCSELYYSKYNGSNPFGLTMKSKDGVFSFLD